LGRVEHTMEIADVMIIVVTTCVARVRSCAG
jgi:hypothetical protein